MDPFNAVIGESRAARAMRAFGARAAAVQANLLLTGESGTGKGILARAIHEASPRHRGPFVAVNCAGIPESLFESEFFGHTRGAFTGAQQSHRGLLEQANGGTLFLDEIGDLALPLQAKLLTAIEDREFRRVGGESLVRIDCRIITATSVNLERAVHTGGFRRDLYHRLLVLCYHVPALRERDDDAVLLAGVFLEQCCRKYDVYVRGFSPHATALLAAHPWPGNIRQLANAVEAAVVAADGDLIEPRHFPPQLLAQEQTPIVDRDGIVAMLERCDGNRSLAARLLGISRNTLRARLREHGLDAASDDARIVQ